MHPTSPSRHHPYDFHMAFQGFRGSDFRLEEDRIEIFSSDASKKSASSWLRRLHCASSHLVCFWNRLEQEIEELETGVPANEGVAKENGGKHPGRLETIATQPGHLLQPARKLTIATWFVILNHSLPPEVIKMTLSFSLWDWLFFFCTNFSVMLWRHL